MISSKTVLCGNGRNSLRISRPRLVLTCILDFGSGLWPRYASPEQIGNGDYGVSTDIFSVGLVLFEMANPHFDTSMERYKVQAFLLTLKVGSCQCSLLDFP